MKVFEDCFLNQNFLKKISLNKDLNLILGENIFYHEFLIENYFYTACLPLNKKKIRKELAK